MAWVPLAAAAVGALSSASSQRSANSQASDAAAQANERAEATRLANLKDNRVDQTNPFGTSVWGTGANGQPTQTTTLNPAQQALLDNKNTVGANLGQASVNLSADMMPTLSKGLDTSGLPAWQNVIGEGSNNLMTHDWLANAANQNGQAVVANSNQATQGPVGNYGPLGSGGASAQPAMVSGSSYGGGGGGVQTTSSASSTPAGGGIRTTFDTSGVTAKLPSTIDDTSRQRVEEALMSRLNPQLANDTSALRTRLLNSGIEVGTDAYNREMTLDSQKGTDARMQAILAGGQEETRQTQLLQSLNDQQFQQALATGKFGQDAETSMAQNATSMSNASTAAGAVLGAAGINNAGASSRLQQQLDQQSREFNVNTGFKAAAFNNDLRNSQMAEQILMRQEPLKELQAMRSLSEPTIPTFQSYYTNNATAPGYQAPMAQRDPLSDGVNFAGSIGKAWQSWN